MGSNILVKDGDKQLIETNNALYGSPRMGMISPVVAAYSGNDKNYSNGGLENSEHKKIIWDLTQRFPESDLAKLVNSTSTELAQANVDAKYFHYVKRSMLVELQYSTLDSSIDKTQPQARMLAELWKQYDKGSYFGTFNNTGVANNPNRITLAETDNRTLSAIIQKVRAGMAKFTQLGFNENTMMQDMAISITPDVYEALSGVGAQRDFSDLNLFKKEFEGAQFLMMNDYMGLSNQVELSLKPLVRHHHGAMPSLWNDYTSADGLTNGNIFAFETSAIEVEEKGAIIKIPVKAGA